MAKNHFNELNDVSENQEEIKNNVNNEKMYVKDDICYHITDMQEDISAYFPKNKEGQAMSENLMEKYLQDLDENTAETLVVNNSGEQDELLAEELKQIYDNDPGYIDNRVNYFYGKNDVDGEITIIKAPTCEELDKENKAEYGDVYRNSGIHKVSWSETDHVEGTLEKNMVLTEGTLLSRWNLPGTDGKSSNYFTDVDVNFDELQMCVSEDKREKHIYEVIKPIRVDISKIGQQPFGNKIPEQEDEMVNQYKSSLSLADLLELGILKEINDKK